MQISPSAKPAKATPIEASHFRRVLGHFCSGVTVVTAQLENDLVGMTCQSFFSLSLDPPLVAFSPAKSSTSYPRIRMSRSFCINILAGDQELLCRSFARSGTDKWRDVAWRPGKTGAPILEGVQAWIECGLEAEHDAGDHYLAVGRVLDLAESDKEPLLFYKGKFGSFG